YTIKVLESRGEDAAEGGMRTVLFQRISEGEVIEISAETDAPNLFAKLPELVEAALEIQRAVEAPGGAPALAEEARRLRFLAGQDDAAALRDVESATPATPEDEPRRRGLLRLIGTAYRTIRAKA